MDPPKHSLDDVALGDLVLLDAVVRLGTITAAARELGMPKPTASRRLARLEERVGETLVHRTTRRVGLSEAGVRFHARVRTLLSVAREARHELTGAGTSGTLRVFAPHLFGAVVLGRVAARFRGACPTVRLEIKLSNAEVDLIRDGIDVAIRIGPQPASSLIGRRLQAIPLRMYAAPRYLQQHPRLVRVADLSRHDVLASPRDLGRLRELGAGWSPALVINDRLALRDAVAAGAGVGILPTFLGEPLRARGEAEPVLPRLKLERASLTALYLPAQARDLRVGHFVTALQHELRVLLAG